MRKWLVGSLLVVAVLVGAALVYAPYLPSLIREGLPPLVWSSDRAGSYAEIAGTDAPRDLHISATATTVRFVSPLAEAFTAKGGKALLVYEDGQLAIEHYEGGADTGTRLNSFSMAKSLVGALVYKALAEGRITSLDQPLGAFLPSDKGIAGVTLRRLLGMRAGIHFENASSLGGISGMDTETSPNPFGPMARLHFQGLGAIEASLSADRTEEAYDYQNVNTALLGEVLEHVYQHPLQDLLAEKLWQPAMAGPAVWREPSAGLPVSAYCCIFATARDWIRVGVFLSENGGRDHPFLPTPLWREFMGLDVPQAELRADHYGAHIRQNILDRPGEDLQGAFTYMFGQGGQLLYLMPERGLVVYRAGESIPLLHSTLYGAWNSTVAARD
jgi:CubicO group peptidase (beta-lactamase class C family)